MKIKNLSVDTKSYKVYRGKEEIKLSVKEFSMNSVCAAGTGSFLDQQAERLKLSIDEFSEMALKSKKPPRIAGRSLPAGRPPAGAGSAVRAPPSFRYR